MKKILLFLFVLVSIFSIGQNKSSYKRGLKFLSKSEKYYQNNEFEKSLFYLEKYENSVLGFCGSSIITTNLSINELKIKNFIALKKFDEALNLIDKKEPVFCEQFQKDDSLKIEILFLKYGKEKVLESFSKSEINNRSLEMGVYTYSLDLIDLNYNFKFKTSERNEYDKKVYSQNDFNNFYFISYNLPIHKLIYNNNTNKEKVGFCFIKKDGNNLKINYESEIKLSEYNKLGAKQKNIIDKFILEKKTKIISATTYENSIKVYYIFLNNKIDEYKIDFFKEEKVIQTINFKQSEFETIKLKEELKKYLINVVNEIENDFLTLKI